MKMVECKAEVEGLAWECGGVGGGLGPESVREWGGWWGPGTHSIMCLFLISQKRKNDNKGPENVIQCEGGSYLDLQYEYQSSTQ